MTMPRGTGGFTLVELLVSMTLASLVMAGVLSIAAAARDIFAAQPEAADLQQRLRIGTSILVGDLMMAGAGRTGGDPCDDEMGAPVRPYRAGLVNDDGAAGTYFRPDVVSIAYAAFSPTGQATGTVRRTYYLRASPPDTFRLMRYDGMETDHPVLEDVVSLGFQYSGVPPPAVPSDASDAAPLDPALFVDGPWCPNDGDPDRFDVDLLRIRRIGVTLRVQAQRPFRGASAVLFAHPGAARASTAVPDRLVRFDVAPRNLNRGS